MQGPVTPIYGKRRRRNGIAMGLAYAATAFGLSWLVLILIVLLWEGFNGLSLAVFTEMTPPPGSAASDRICCEGRRPAGTATFRISFFLADMIPFRVA